MAVVDTICQEKKQLFANISLSVRSVAGLIECLF